MIGGLLKSSSRVAMVAAAGLVSGGVAAQAADLGGNCCADLEERVAELEATTARKGNRKVSLTVSGHVHEAIVFWDVDSPLVGAPETESNIYIGTHNSSRSRFRFKGDASINADWSAGFFIEIGLRAESIFHQDQEEYNTAQRIDIRHEALWLKSKTYGTVWLGWTSAAADGITEVCLGCGLGNFPDWSDNMGSLKLVGNNIRTFGSLNGAFAGEGDRREVVKYISPTFAGFSLSTSYSQDDYWDVALRYAGEFGGFRVAGGVAYLSDTSGGESAGFAHDCAFGPNRSTADCQGIGASASIQHTASGIYVMGAYGQSEDDRPGVGRTDTSWHVTAGINTKMNSLGKTNIWGMYTNGDREIGLGGTVASFIPGTALEANIPAATLAATLNSTELEIWGFGINQKIDAAAMEIYLWYHHMEATANVAGVGSVDVGESDVVTLGARIKF